MVLQTLGCFANQCLQVLHHILLNEVLTFLFSIFHLTHFYHKNSFNYYSIQLKSFHKKANITFLNLSF
jgi:hypothetical protein